MNAKKNDDFSDDFTDDNFEQQNADMNEELGDLADDQFDDYDLSDTDALEEPSELTEETDLLGDDEQPVAEITEEVESKPAKRGMLDLLKENWLFVAIGLVVVAIAGYMIMSVMSPSSPPPAQQQTQGSFKLPAQQQTTTTTQQTTTATTDTGQQQSVATPMAMGGTNIVMSQDDMKTLMQGFQQMVQQNSQSIQSSLQSIIDNTNQANTNATAITAMQTEFANLGKEIKNYSQNINALNARLDTLQSQLSILVAQQTAQEEKLTLRAIVPGRAWLIDDKGRTITVVEGTQIGNFGTVTNIDSTKGQVETSSGYIFK